MNTIYTGSRWLTQIKMALSIGALAIAHQAGAATADMLVTGVINPSTACTANLNTTRLSYGDIPLNELDQSKPTALVTKSLILHVACAPSASKFYFRIIDRAVDASYAPEDLSGVAGVPPGDDRYNIGLGLGTAPADRPIGGLFLKAAAVLADGQNKILLRRYTFGNDDGEPWSVPPSNFVWGTRKGTLSYTPADPVSEITTAAKNFTIQMNAIPVISSLAIRDLSTDLQLGGKFTIEIVQL